MALKFADHSAAIVCADRDPMSRGQKEGATHEILQERGRRSIFVRTDVSDEMAVQKLIQEAVREYGRLDMHVLLHIPSKVLRIS